MSGFFSRVLPSGKSHGLLHDRLDQISTSLASLPKGAPCLPHNSFFVVGAVLPFLTFLFQIVPLVRSRRVLAAIDCPSSRFLGSIDEFCSCSKPSS